nr:MAG TPA: hypothetical protein [Caudoviricetes sp.]
MLFKVIRSVKCRQGIDLTRTERIEVRLRRTRERYMQHEQYAVYAVSRLT